MKNPAKYLLKYKNWILFFIFLLICFLYLDKQVMLSIKQFKQTYPLEYAYLKKFCKLIGSLYKLFVGIVIFLGLCNFFSKNKKEKGIKIILTVVIVGILSQVKYLIGRERPKITFETVFKGPSKKYVYASFPSGHIFFIFAIARVLSYVYSRYKVFFYLFAVLVALQRLLVFAHFPSDIIAGAFLGDYISKVIILKTSKKPSPL